MPVAEVTLTERDVRTLLLEQHPDLAQLPLTVLANGWDNLLMRLGDDLLVRLPRREAAAVLIEHEQRWLPELAPHLSLPVPVPLRTGRPGPGYPWSWSITAFLPGEVASPVPDDGHLAEELGRFLALLHRPAPPDAPRNPFRGVPLGDRDQSFRDNLALVDPSFDRGAMLAAWRVSVAAQRWDGAQLWVHGDLHPANVLVVDGHVAAVLDFGDITSGDPATDLAIVYLLLHRHQRQAFWDAYAQHALHEVTPALDLRARGWALALGTVLLARSGDNARMHQIGVQAVSAVLRAATEG